MCQLLGSTNKAEVLENMEFFRIAWEYQFDGAETPHSNTLTYSPDVLRARVNSSIKKILQLIWEDGKEPKGVHSRLLVLLSQLLL